MGVGSAHTHHVSRKSSRRPPIYLKEFIQEGVKDVLLWKRHTQRKLATFMGVSKTTVHHWIVASTIHVHCNSLKPVLTEENKVARLLMALHFRDPLDPTKYCDMLDWIHLDEKWFFLTWEKERSLLLPEEKNPKHCIKHKSLITKVMFLCAIACPRLTFLQILGGMANWGYGQLVIGNRQNINLKINQKEHWFGRIRK